MARYVIVLIIWLSVVAGLQAQVINGRITDINGNPVRDASLFIKELKLGTAANEQGYYELKLAPGVYTCVFQCLGYDTEIRVVSIVSGAVVQNIALREKAYEIKEIIVSNKNEDPAYLIMRRAIAMAPYYMNQVSEYKADVYLKGTLKVEKISALVKRMAKDDLKEYNIKEGDSYLEESFNEIEFTAPNKYKQKVIKRTGSLTGSQSGNAMTLLTTSIYDAEEFEPIISPLSTSAFSHYKFRYEGFINEDNRIINKIKITPVRKSKQLLSGYIYIVDDFWNVHSVDVSGEFFMGVSYRMQVNFGEVIENVWMPVSHRFNFDASVLGNKGAFLYIASVKYTDIVENKSLRKPASLAQAEQQRKAIQQNQSPPVILTEKTPPTNKTSAKVENLLEKENLSNREAYQLARLMKKEAEAEKKENKSLDLSQELRNDYKITVDSAANERDTTFWETMRPVPLSPDELKSYEEKEKRLAAAPQKNDTTKNQITLEIQNPALQKIGKALVGTTGKVLFGTNIKIGKTGKYGNIQYRGIKPSKLGFNTVDGFYIGQKLTYNKNFKWTNNPDTISKTKISQMQFTLSPEVVWAINRNTVMWDVAATLTYSPIRRGYASIKFGQNSEDFNTFRGIHTFENTISSLFFRRNYLKLYENSFVTASNSIDISNGLQLITDVKYSRRATLTNYSDSCFSFFYNDSRKYSLNIPDNAVINNGNNPNALTNNTAAIFSLSFNYTPRHYYRIDRNNRKRYIKSNYPTIYAGWQKGISGVFGSNSNFDHIYLGVQQKIETGLMQEFRYYLRVGVFANSKNIYFSDFKHFATSEIPLTINSISSQSFNLLHYYKYSTSDKYIQAHTYYNTPFLLLKMLPFFSNRMLWQEGLQFNYLYTPNIKNYMELGYTIGMEDICEVGVFAGFENFGELRFGVRCAILIR